MRKLLATLLAVVGLSTPALAQNNHIDQWRPTTPQGVVLAAVDIEIGAHASFRANNVCVDPGNRFDFAGMTCDVIVVTHGHMDHFTPASVQTAAHQGTVIIGPPEVIGDLREENAPYGIIAHEGTVGTFAGVTVQAFPVYNDPHSGDRLFHDEGCCYGYVLTFAGDFKVLVSGDTSATALYNARRTYGFVDIAFLAVDAPFAMGYEEAARLVNTAFDGTFIYPYHDGDYGIAPFLALVNQPVFIIERDWYPNGSPFFARLFSNAVR